MPSVRFEPEIPASKRPQIYNLERAVAGIGQFLFIVPTSAPRRDEVTGEWRRLHNEELNGLYPSPNIVRVIKSRRMR